MFRLYPERPEDTDEVDLLFDLAFAPGRTALSSYRLREGVAPLADLSCVVRDEYDALAGAVRYWPVRLGAAPALLLGPIAVHPTRQGEGLGAMLMSQSLERAETAGWRHVLLIGDEPYYRRFGFLRVPVSFPPPTNPDRILGRVLGDGCPDALQGSVSIWSEGPVARSHASGGDI